MQHINTHRQPTAASDITSSHTAQALILTPNSLFCILQATQFCSFFPLPTVTTRFVAGIAKGDRNQVCPATFCKVTNQRHPQSILYYVSAGSQRAVSSICRFSAYSDLLHCFESHHCIYLLNLFRLLDLVLRSFIHPSTRPNPWSHLSDGTRRRAQTELTVEEIALGSQKAAPHLIPSVPDITTLPFDQQPLLYQFFPYAAKLALHQNSSLPILFCIHASKLHIAPVGGSYITL